MGIAFSSYTFSLLIVSVLLIFLAGYLIGKRFTRQSMKLQTLGQYYRSLFDYNPDVVIICDLEGNFSNVNRTVERYGYKESDLLNCSFVPYIVPDQLEVTLQYFEKSKKGESTNFNTTFISKSGDQFEVNVSTFPIVVKQRIVGVYAVLKDIKELKTVQTELAEAEAKYRSLTENSLVGTYITQDGKFVYANPKLIELSGYSKEEFIDSSVMDYIHPEDQSLILENVKKRAHDMSSTSHYHYRIIKKDQTVVYIENFGSAMVYKGKPAAIGTIVDITDRKKAEETIEYMAYHDSLTGLFNRNYFSSRLEACLGDESVRSIALLYVDLDNLKLINDALGEEVGDKLMKGISERLKNCVQTPGVIGRNRGDEFLVYFPNLNKEELDRIAERMILSVNEPFNIDKYELYMTISIGISYYQTGIRDVEELIRKAQQAVIQVKRNGKNSYQFNEINNSDCSYERFELEMDLRKAIEHEEFLLYYQPKFDLTLGKIKGAEALVRWNHPIKGVISPGEFIRIAEETGLIIPIGEWVLRTACYQTKIWHENSPYLFEVSVNLSVRQLYQPNLVERVKDILEETGLNPKYLEIEITESMMADRDHAFRVLNDLKKLGVKISMDDFGTGYSSLHFLKDVPIDKLKIDQSFIRQCTTHLNDANIIKTIIAMAHQLNLEVVAEGVETTEHLIFLQQNLCDQAQGYLFSKPLNPDEFIQKIREVGKIANNLGIPKELQNRKWMEKALEIARYELLETIKQQQGMTYKIIKEESKFIHTLCDGQLTYNLGLVPEQIIGSELIDFQPIQEAERQMHYYYRAWNGEQNVVFESERNGISYLTYLRPIIRGGEVIEVIGSCVDITERKKVEEALKSSEYKYRIITENMLDLIIVLDISGICKFASPSHETVLGIAPTQYEGKEVFDLIHPDDIPLFQKKLYYLLMTKTPNKVEFRHKTAFGGWVQVEAQFTPVFGEDYEVKDVIVVGRDISERKKTEEMLRKSEKLSVAGQLAAGVAHEIRNPLTSIKGFLQLMKKETLAPSYTDLMLSEVDQIEKTIKEFFNFANLQDNKLEPNDMIIVLKSVLTLYGSQAMLNNIEITQEYEYDLPQVYCDSNQIKQVFVNILQNAVEAMPQGGTIKIELKKTDSNEVTIRFIDQGKGISEERLQKMGEPFYNTREKGTGLGLMVSYKIVQEHGGTIQIESTLNKGTIVDVCLPINQFKGKSNHELSSSFIY